MISQRVKCGAGAPAIALLPGYIFWPLALKARVTLRSDFAFREVWCDNVQHSEHSVLAEGVGVKSCMLNRVEKAHRNLSIGAIDDGQWVRTEGKR